MIDPFSNEPKLGSFRHDVLTDAEAFAERKSAERVRLGGEKYTDSETDEAVNAYLEAKADGVALSGKPAN